MANIPQLNFSLLCLLFSLLISSSYLITLSQSADAQELCNPNEKKILLQIKNQLGPNAYFFDTWHPDTDCCRTWFNVACDDKTHKVNYLTIGQTVEISGEIPPVVGELSSLEVLYFNDLPGLTGPIPSAISKLTNLKDLEFFRTKLTGPVPSSLGRLTKLETLDLSKNRLSGPIPASLSLLTNLQRVKLDTNQLSGSIPESLGSLKNLIAFQAQGNRLSGDASFLFGKDKKELIVVELQNNTLSFDLSKVEFPLSIKGIDLNHNMVYGSIPKQLAQLKLKLFNVSYNGLCGPIPSGNWLTQFGPNAFGHNKCLCGAPLPPCH